MTEESDASRWTWRAPDRDRDERLLLYEPGNWGDALKGSWALLALRALLHDGASRPLRYLDPCAGLPTYPLVEAAARRLERLRGRVFFEAQRPFTGEGRLASTGRLVREGCVEAGAEYELQLFDADPERLRAWKQFEAVRMLEIGCGEEAFDAAPDADLILVDPYDFFDHWGRWLPRAAEAAKRALVLAYLYNKAPRGRGYLEQYQRLRARLATTGVDGVLGRIPADAVLPRAYHEVVLLGPRRRIQRLKPGLATETRELSRLLADDGAFEEISVNDE